MTFNWKYALFTNTPIFLTLIIYTGMTALHIDPIGLIFVVVAVWLAWYTYAGWKVYPRHPEFNYHNYQRSSISMIIITFSTIGFLFLLLKLQLIGNIALFISWIAISNFFVDGFAKYKDLQ
ncbi:phage-shock protein [Lentilactobacillus parakefiri]|uniref:Phage-shock protein n=1 Tax=Lentilactobacillus parakefiri TaxID=152332 RepID=A0A269YDN8_9LACO|nr:phage-shock protein [Lentilactobacillus parakefiri]PAK83654.1 phage-shock protein [Lentilactobacillus parakefiri]